MLRRFAPMAGALMLVVSLAATPVLAEEQGGTDLVSVLRLLTDKKVITPQEASEISRRGEGERGLQALVQILKEKGVLDTEEGVAVAAKAKVPAGAAKSQMLPPSRDKEFIALLRERWVANKNRPRDFDEWFAGNNDPNDIIARMQVMGSISAEESATLQKYYRDNYVTGVVSTVMENKEQDYLQRVRKDVAWEVDEKLKEAMKDDWSRRVRVSGDVRLRYEGDYFDPNNADFLKPDNPTQLMNTKEDRQMLRIRARLGVDAKVSDDWSAAIGIATGTTNNPVSTNVTLGDSLNKKPIALDKAYIKWSPTPAFSMSGGRFPSPWLSTDLVWDPDVNFDGIALQYAPQLNDRWGLFLASGVFPIQEIEFSQHDKWLIGNQLGFTYKSPQNTLGKLAVAYYAYTNTVGVVNDPANPGATDWSAPQYQQKGNTLMDIDPGPAVKTAYASAFRELNVTGTLDLPYWDPVHLIFTGDYVKNVGFKRKDVEARTGTSVSPETQGFQVAFSLGYPDVRELWDWKAVFSYKYLQRDAVMDAFTDSDFHLGGTNAKGWIAGGDLGVGKNVWLSTRWYSANEISGPPLSIDVFQFNVNAKF